MIPEEILDRVMYGLAIVVNVVCSVWIIYAIVNKIVYNGNLITINQIFSVFTLLQVDLSKKYTVIGMVLSVLVIIANVVISETSLMV